MSNAEFILAIEITNPGAGAGSVAIGRLTSDGVTDMDVESVGSGGRASGAAGFGGHDDDLMPAIERVCRRVGLDVRSGSLRRVGVSVGPGGYTSTRVACAVGKMIAAASGAECVGVPTARVVLEAAPAEVQAGRVAVALAGKGETSWVQVFAGGMPQGEGVVLNHEGVSRLLASGVRTVIADRFLPDAIRREAERAGAAVIEPTFDAGACARLATKGTPIDPAELVPIYPREPDAVTLWRAKKKT